MRHEKFKELSALANAGELPADDRLELMEHLSVCEECRAVHDEYRLLDRQGMPILAAANLSSTREKLLARVRAADKKTQSRRTLRRAAWAAAAACIGALVFGSYQFRQRPALDRVPGKISVAQTPVAKPAPNPGLSDLLRSQAGKILRLEADGVKARQESSKLRAGLQAASEQVTRVMTSKSATEEQLRAVFQQRDSMAFRLQTAEQAEEALRGELGTLRAERDQSASRAASLEARINDLSSLARDQERRLGNQEQYLSSDRDIRELMGARKLYIADVYDVDSSSRTRKPFGRVFYTQGKSLIFYAFDLDREPGLKNVSASAFQVWGKRSSGQTFNLGILYEDNVANRRWALRSDDPSQLAEINAIFVTVEPNGGSRKPTGKPFLFALLRKEVNHP